jgi:hypothetical protein
MATSANPAASFRAQKKTGQIKGVEMSGAPLYSVYVSRSARRNGTVPVGTPLKAKGLNDSKAPQLTEVASQLQRLAPYARKLRSQLSSAAAQELRSVTGAIAILRGTDHYDALRTLILETFKDRPYEIGTVGAYFANCTAPAARDTCSPACVGNLVLDDGVEDTCPVRVFILKHEGHASRVLLAANDVPDPAASADASSTAEGAPASALAPARLETLPTSSTGGKKAIVYIYLEDGESLGGLTQSEIATLAGLGVSDVRVAYYDPQTTETTDVTAGFVPLSSVAPVPAYSSSSGSSFWLALLAIIVVVALVALVWALFRKQKAGEGPAAAGGNVITVPAPAGGGAAAAAAAR